MCQLWQIINKDHFILSQLKEHMDKNTGMVENRKCYVCGKAFSAEHHFELHMRLHNNEKPCENLMLVMSAANHPLRAEI